MHSRLSARFTRLAAGAALVALPLATLPLAASAQSAGTHQLSFGPMWVMPNSSSDPMTITRVGNTPVNVSQPGSGAKVENAMALGIQYEYWFTDNWSGELVLGLPPKLKMKGEGTMASLGEIGTARLYQPTLLAKYNFGQPADTLRPYLGFGLAYIWFGDAKITNPAFESAVMKGATSVKVDNAIAPVLTGGAQYKIDSHWSAVGSLSYAPFTTKLKLSSATMDAETKSKMNTVVFTIGAKYSF